MNLPEVLDYEFDLEAAPPSRKWNRPEKPQRSAPYQATRRYRSRGATGFNGAHRRRNKRNCL